ncbi:PAS domain S-box protein [Candidatus Dojkabacteria bacterium]|nr:PAS domain S-box protein [Candidatus Dojkabacteria bacterium]
MRYNYTKVTPKQSRAIMKAILTKVNRQLEGIDQTTSIQTISQQTTDILRKQLDATSVILFLKKSDRYAFQTSSQGKYNKFFRLIHQKLKRLAFLKTDSKNVFIDTIEERKTKVINKDSTIFDDVIGKAIIRSARKVIGKRDVILVPCIDKDDVPILLLILTNKDTKRMSLDEFDRIGQIVAKVMHSKLNQEKALNQTINAVLQVIQETTLKDDAEKIAETTVNILHKNETFNSVIFISTKERLFKYKVNANNDLINFADKLTKKYVGSNPENIYKNKNLVSKAFETKRTVYTEGNKNVFSPPHPSIVSNFFERNLDTKETAIIPCIGETEVLSIIIISTNSNFSKAQKQLFEILGREVGYAIENKMLLKEKEAEKEELISIIDNSTDGLMVFEDDELIYASPKLSQITEYTVDEIEASEDGTFLIEESEKAKVNEIVSERESSKDTTSTYYSKLKTKSGNIVPVEIRTVKYKKGGKTLMNVSFRDTSRTDEAKQQLENLYSNQAKLFSEIAHSLKTPFTIIYGLLELEESEDNEIFKLIREELDIANKKVSNLLKISRMEIFDYPVTMKPISLNEFMEAFYVKAKSLGYKYCDKNHSYECGCFQFERPKEKLEIQADNEVLMDIFMTLAENAYIHSPRKNRKPEIALQLEKKGKYVKITLKDKGKGMSKSQKEKLFKPFANKMFKPTGHGIGLPMCKRMVEKMGGVIEVESVREQGTKFSITYPLND